jgi:outer membrane protein assembly factor BamB
MKAKSKIILTGLFASFLTSSLAQSPGTKLWEFSTGNPLSFSPALGQDGTLYFGSSDGNFYALNPDGSQKWRFNAQAPVSSSPVVAADGTIYFGCDGNRFYALAPNGTELWHFDTGASVRGQLTLGASGLICFGSRDGKVQALDRNGNEQWVYPTDMGDAPPLALGRDGTIYAGTLTGLLALHSDGSSNWAFAPLAGPLTPLAIAGDATIYAGALGWLFAVNSDGTQKWRVPVDGTISGVALAEDGTIYIGCGRPGGSFLGVTLYAFNTNGIGLWSDNRGLIFGSPPTVAADGTLYYGAWDNLRNFYFLVALNSDGSLKWQFALGANTAGISVSSGPALGPYGDVYFSTLSGRVIALGGDSLLANSPWPTSGHDLSRSSRPWISNVQPFFEAPVSQTNGFLLDLTGLPASRYLIQASSDLKQWETITNVTSANGMLQVVVEGLPAYGQRFYRAIQDNGGALSNPSTNNLPARSLPTGPALRPPVGFVQTRLRIAHLPPADWRQISSFLQKGYQVLAINTLERWDRIGPASVDYDPQTVSDAETYIRQFVNTTHAYGAKAILYMGPVQSPLFSPQFRANHPAWLRVNPNGSLDQNYVNFRNPDFVNWLSNQLVSLVSTYRADGFWFDGYSPEALHTYDTSTRNAFKAYSGGYDIPTSIGTDPISQLYLHWHYSYFASLADQIRQAIRASNPNVVIYGNYSANRTWYPPAWPRGEYPAYYATSIDLPSVELYWDNPGDALFQQFVYAFTQGTSHDLGARAWVQPHAEGITGTPPLTEILLRCLAGAPWGVYAEFVENAEREEYYEAYVNEVKAYEQWWQQSQAIPYIGIVASEQTRLLLGTETYLQYFSHTLGAFRALFEAHLPVRVLSEYDLENADLEGITVLVLPDVRVLSDRSSEVVRQFVKAGGGLVASRGTSLYNPNFVKRSNFSLADVFRADYVGNKEITNASSSVSLWLAAPDHPILNDPKILGQQKTAWRVSSGSPPAQGWLDLVGSTTLVRPRGGGQTLVLMSTNENLGSPYPAMIASSYGQGRVVYLPAAIDKALYFFPNTYLRSMLVNACKWVAQDAKPPVEVDAPIMLAVTYRSQPAQRRTVVHLLNDQSSYGRHSIYQKMLMTDGSLLGPWPGREEILPLKNIAVRCRIGGISKATQQPENVPLPLTPLADGGVQVIVPTVNMYSLVVFE